MAPNTKYTDFTESEPIEKNGRPVVPVSCPKCNKSFDISESSLKSNKSTRCKRHLEHECTVEAEKRQRVAAQEAAAPADPSAVLDTPANEERSRKLERDVEVLKEGQRRHQGYFDQAAQLLSLAIPCHPPAMIQEIQSRNVLMAPRADYDSRIESLQATVDEQRDKYVGKFVQWESTLDTRIAELESKVMKEQERADEERAKRLKLADEKEDMFNQLAEMRAELHRAQEDVKQTKAAMMTNKEELDARYTAAKEHTQAADVKVKNVIRKAKEDVKTAQSSISAIEEKYKETLAQNEMLGEKCVRLARDVEYRKQFLGKVQSKAYHEFKTSNRIRPGTPTLKNPHPPSPRPCDSPQPNTSARLTTR